MKTNSNISQISTESSIQHKNVYGYIRVSTETQADKGYGLDIQEAAIKEYCKENDLNLLKTYIDAGKSGAIGDKDDFSNRPALVELLNTLNGTNTIIVMNRARLWRDDIARVYISQTVKKLGGDILSIEEQHYSLYSKDPHDFLINSMMEMLDQYDRMCINMRLTKGKNEKAKQGFKPAGRAPLGYKWNKETRQIEVNEQEAAVVKEMFSIAKRRLGFTYIAKQMNAKKLLGRNGKPWSKQSVRVVLANKFYTGILIHQEEETQGQHIPIIDKELFDYVQICRNITQDEMDEMYDDNVL